MRHPLRPFPAFAARALPGYADGWPFDDLGHRRIATANGRTATDSLGITAISVGLNPSAQRNIPSVGLACERK